MEQEEFEKLVIEALENLPRLFKDKLENIDVVVEEISDKQQLKQVGISSAGLLLGLYQGVPLKKRTRYYGMVIPDKIIIFKRNIEQICATKDEIKSLVEKTVQHEIAHHFGISDKRLRELGTY